MVFLFIWNDSVYGFSKHYMRNFGQAMAVSTVPLLTALLQRHLVVLAISSNIQELGGGGEYRLNFEISPFCGTFYFNKL